MNHPSAIQIKTVTTEPFSINGKIVRLQARAITLRLPFAGVVWNRPTAVLVRTANGAEYRLAVRDVTRLAQVLAIALGIASALFLSLVLRERPRGVEQ